MKILFMTLPITGKYNLFCEYRLLSEILVNSNIITYDKHTYFHRYGSRMATCSSDQHVKVGNKINLNHIGACVKLL